MVVVACGYARPETCEELGDRVIDLSEESEGPFSPKILKLYDVRSETPEDGNILQCWGRAKWNRGDESPIRFYIWEDEDSDSFMGYTRLD